MTQGPARCTVRFGLRRCGARAVGEIPLCNTCLDELFQEPDPRRRRTLASIEHLPLVVIERLAHDEDEFVRIGVAARSDLPPSVARTLASPGEEPCPDVWRALAMSASVASTAETLQIADDTVTLKLLAANPATPPSVLDELAEHRDPDIASIAIGARAGLRPALDPSLASSPTGDQRPISAPPFLRSLPTRPGTAGDPPFATDGASPRGRSSIAAWKPPSDPLPERVTRDTVIVSKAEPHRFTFRPLHMSLMMIGVLFCGLALGMTLSRGSSPHTPSPAAVPASTTNQTASTSPAPPTPTTHPTPKVSERDHGSTTTTPTTTAPVTPATASPPDATAPAERDVRPPDTRPAQIQTPAPAPVAPASVPAGPVSRSITVTSTSGSFCSTVRVSVNVSPSPATITVTDSAGRTVATWAGASGQTRHIALPHASRTLTIHATATGTAMTLSASAAGNSC